jgi:hypothetical protein
MSKQKENEIHTENSASLADPIPEKDTSVSVSLSADVHDFVVQVENPYKGLGLPVLYGTLSILANKSVFFIGGRGIGKTRAVKCIPAFPYTVIGKWDTFTLGELNKTCQENESSPRGVRNKHFVFEVEDFSTLSEYHREIFLTVCSKIVSDNNYRHITDITPNLLIENCKLTMLIAIQPRIYSRLSSGYSQWESMSYDRLSKFLLFNPLRQGITLDTNFVPTLPRKISIAATLPTTLDLQNLVTLFKGQISEGRAYLYAMDYAIAMARIQGKTEVEQDDVNTFYRLFSPYLEPFSRLQQRIDLDSTMTVSTGHIELLTQIGRYLDGVNKQELSEILRVTDRHIERSAEFLLRKKLIRQEENTYIYQLS